MPPVNTHSRREARNHAERVPLDGAPIAAAAPPAAATAPAKPVKKATARTAPPRTAASAGSQGVKPSNVLPETTDQDRGRQMTDQPEEITRRSRNARTVDVFAIPDNWKRTGYDYQWWVTTVMGQPVEGTTEIYEGGWRPVKWGDVPQPWNPGATADQQVCRGGQALYLRPLHLTHEAKHEEFKAAEQQKKDRVQSALEGRVSGAEGLSDVKGVVPRGTVSIEGEVGTQARRSHTS